MFKSDQTHEAVVNNII